MCQLPRLQILDLSVEDQIDYTDEKIQSSILGGNDLSSIINDSLLGSDDFTDITSSLNSSNPRAIRRALNRYAAKLRRLNPGAEVSTDFSGNGKSFSLFSRISTTCD
jgi:hypothetical protein